MTDPAVPQVNQILQVSGGENTRGPIAWNEPGRAWAFPSSGGQHDRVGGEGEPAGRTGHLHGPLAGPVGDHGALQQGGAGGYGPRAQHPGIVRAADEPVQVA